MPLVIFALFAKLQEGSKKKLLINDKNIQRLSQRHRAQLSNCSLFLKKV